VGNTTVSIKKESNGLAFYQGNNKVKLNFTTETDFFILERPGTEFMFTKDTQNKVDGINQKRGSNIIKISKIE